MRITLIASVAAAATLGLAFAAQAGDPPPASNSQSNHSASNKKADPDRVRCKTEEVLGSHLPGKRICHTNREWDELTEQAHQQMDMQATHQSGSPR